MIPHDQRLCEQALELEDYWELFKLEDKCLTEEGKKFIHNKAVKLYHEEEARAGIL